MKKTLTILIAVLVVGGFLGFRLLTVRARVSQTSATQDTLLGLHVREITLQDRQKYPHLGTGPGIVVDAVYANGLAEGQGIRIGDQIIAVNGQRVSDAGQYEAVLDQALLGQTLTLHLRRADGEAEVSLSIADAASFNSLGNAYFKDGRLEEARRAYQRALELDPTLAEAYYNLGNLQMRQKRYEAALESFKMALKYREDFPTARYRLAEVLTQLGKQEEAIQTYRALIPFTPQDVAEAALKPVEVVEAVRGEIRSSLELSGTLKPRAQVRVFPKAAGMVEQWRIAEGDFVERDQVLAVIEHDRLEWQLEQAEAALEAARQGYEQAQQLAEIRVRSQVAQARAGVVAAEAALQQVRDLARTRVETQIEQAEAGLKALQANLEKIRRGAREEERGQIRATLAQAEAHLEQIRSDYERVRKLYEQDAVSQQTFESMQTQLRVAEQQVEAARQQWQLVEKGARPEDIRAVEAQVQQAEATFRLARTQMERRTWQKDIQRAEAQLAQAQALLQTAEAQVAARSWEAEIAAARMQWVQARVARDLAKKQLEDAFVKAPLRGVIARRYVDQGATVSPSVPLAELVDVEELHVTVGVLESDLPRIHLGGSATIRVATLTEPLQGEITRIFPTVDERSHTVEVEVTVSQPQRDVKPGMFAQVNLPIVIHPDAVLLPRGAIQEMPDGTRYVWRVQGGRVFRTPVKLGLTQDSQVEILQGLNPGDPVVIAGHQGLRNGDPVRVVQTAPAR